MGVIYNSLHGLVQTANHPAVDKFNGSPYEATGNVGEFIPEFPVFRFTPYGLLAEIVRVLRMWTHYE